MGGTSATIGRIETYEIMKVGSGFLALDEGIVMMDVFVGCPVYVLGGIMLWRRHRWGLILSVAGLVMLTCSAGIFPLPSQS